MSEAEAVDPRLAFLRARLLKVRDGIDRILRVIDGDPEERARVHQLIEDARSSGIPIHIAAAQEVLEPGGSKDLLDGLSMLIKERPITKIEHP